jgi:Polyketide cyclase / dehydrase and lipid transport
MSCQVKHLTSAKPATVYDLLMDVEHWSDWMPTVTAATWEQPGDPDTGLGVSGGYATGSASHATRSPAERDRITTPTRQRFPVTFPSRTTRVTSVLNSSPTGPDRMDDHVRFAHPRPSQTTSVHGPVNVRADSGGAGTGSRADRPLASRLCFRANRANSHLLNTHRYQLSYIAAQLNSSRGL